MDTQTDPNTSVETAQSATNQTMINQTTADRKEKKQIQYSNPTGQRNRSDKNKHTNMVGTNFRKHTSYVQSKPRRNDG